MFRYRTANREDGAHLDIVAENFWGRDRQNAFFNIRVFNPYAPKSSWYHFGTMLQKKRAREETCLRRESDRSGARILLTPRVLTIRRDGSNNYCHGAMKAELPLRTDQIILLFFNLSLHGLGYDLFEPKKKKT